MTLALLSKNEVIQSIGGQVSYQFIVRRDNLTSLNLSCLKHTETPHIIHLFALFLLSSSVIIDRQATSALLNLPTKHVPKLDHTLEQPPQLVGKSSQYSIQQIQYNDGEHNPLDKSQMNIS